MAYTTPITFVAGNPLTAAQMNVIQDNIKALKDPPAAEYVGNEVSDYSTSSTTFVDVDATNFALQITTTGGDVIVGFNGGLDQQSGTSSTRTYFDVAVDGVREAGDDGMTWSAGDQQLCFTWIITGLAAGTYTFKLQWKHAAAGTSNLAAGAGTSGYDTHPQFWVREI